MHNFPDDEHDKDFEDEEFDDEFDEEFDEDLDEEFEDEDFEEELEEEESEKEEEEEEEPEEEEKEEAKAREPPPKAQEKAPKKEAAQEAQTQAKIIKDVKPITEKEDKKLAKPGEIPLTVSVEVGRLKINVKKLLEIQPGNLIELDVNPEEPVDLVVEGKCVAKGELLRVGDALGIRILELG